MKEFLNRNCWVLFSDERLWKGLSEYELYVRFMKYRATLLVYIEKNSVKNTERIIGLQIEQWMGNRNVKETFLLGTFKINLIWLSLSKELKINEYEKKLLSWRFWGMERSFVGLF